MIFGDDAQEPVKFSPDFVGKGRGGGARQGSAPEREHRSAQQGEVGGGVAGAAAAFVLKEGGVAGMVVFVFDVPVQADVAEQFVQGPVRGVGNEEPSPAGALGTFALGGLLLYAFAGHLDDAPDAGEAHLQWVHSGGADAALVKAAVLQLPG